MQSFLVICFILVAAVTAVPPHSDLYKNTITPFKTRIVGGFPAERYQFPYQVSLRWSFLNLFTIHVCGGTLISQNFVLTAGHCKFAFSELGNFDVALGQLNLTENNNDVQIIAVSDFIVHPQYSGGVSTNDIAVIQLQQPAELSKAVQLAPLGTDEDCNAIEDAVLSGWGLVSSYPETAPVILNYAELPRLTNKRCAQNLLALLNDTSPLDDTMLCTGSNPNKDQSACSGDSGGPLVRKSNGKLIGVVSWGISPCGVHHESPSVYTRVCSHLNFIKHHTG